MKYQSLYRKYRPSDFKELYGQEIAKTILKNSIINEKLSHAYLFFGPRGTGKTSMAKMFARICNCKNNVEGNCCENCENCIESREKSCIDIVEIDAASNNGVDEIRELKNKISLVPSKLKYKIYIIDEVHMLSIGAFNALLKTLEEPPEHVIFILATTEFYKVPNTIVSRCQTIEFKNIENKNIVNRLKEISNREHIEITDDALNEIAIYSNGGLRDALGLLEKVCLFKEKKAKIEIDDVQKSFGMVSKIEIKKICELIENNSENEILEFVEKYISGGNDLFKITNQILLNFRDEILFNKKYELIEKIKIINDYQEKMKKTHNISLLFEMLFIELCYNTNVRAKKETITNELKSDKNIKTEEKQKVNESLKPNIKKLNKNIRINNCFAGADKNKLLELKRNWENLKNSVFDNKVGSLCCDLVDAIPIVCSNTNLMLCTEYSSTSEKINESIEQYEKIIKSKLENDLKLVSVCKEEWDELKKEYVKNIKNNYEYKYINENSENIVNLEQKNDTINCSNIVTKAKELFADFEIEEE